MEQMEIAELKKRVQQLEEMALEMHKAVYSASVSTHQIEEAIRKLNFFSLEKIIETIEHAISAYRGSCRFKEEMDTLSKKQTQVMFSSIGR